MKENNRIVTAFIALTVVFALFFSLCFIIVQADHDCFGENCPICYQINICENMFRSIDVALTVSIIFSFSFFCFYALSLFATKIIRTVTLVTLKVKLTD